MKPNSINNNGYESYQYRGWLMQKLPAKLLTIWEKLSMLGIPKDLEGSERKVQILMNQVASFAIYYFLILTPTIMIVFGVIAAIKSERNIWEMTVYHIMGPLIFFPFSALMVYMRIKRPETFLRKGWAYRWTPTIMVVGTNLSQTWLSLCLQPESGYFFFMTLTIPGYIIVTPKLKFNLPSIIALLEPLSTMAFVLWWNSNGRPLAPAWDWALEPLKYIVFFTIVFAVFFLVFYLHRESMKSELALIKAHSESERLLLNILPFEISKELKVMGKTTPREYESVTVLFTDFVGFTKTAEILPAKELINELDLCFSYFDSVTKKFGLEKIKTIGDSYMAVAGLPTQNYSHPIDACLAALEIQEFMYQVQNIRAAQGFPYWQLRLGMHTGPVIAGVVGKMKFAYDIWGDTVNTASRLESSGTSYRVNISGVLYEKIHHLFNCEYRGKLPVKNKKSIDMYYLTSLKPQFAKDEALRIPNEEFLDIYNHVKTTGNITPHLEISQILTRPSLSIEDPQPSELIKASLNKT